MDIKETIDLLDFIFGIADKEEANNEEKSNINYEETNQNLIKD